VDSLYKYKISDNPDNELLVSIKLFFISSVFEPYSHDKSNTQIENVGKGNISK